MGEALLRRRLGQAGFEAQVGSAGFLASGASATLDAIETMAMEGLDISEHQSRRLSPSLIEESDLIITMTRQHLVDVTVMAPDAWTHVFQIQELIRRAEAIGPWPVQRTFAEWLAAVGEGRTRSSLIHNKLYDDVADPIGQSRAVYARTKVLLDDLSTRLAAVI
jgi:protein-tyrosine phosphatase